MNADAPWPSPAEARERVLGIQTKLHRWATDGPNRRFDDLHNLIYDPAVLVDAWHRVRRNRGARTAGVDGETAHYISVVRGEHDLVKRTSSPDDPTLTEYSGQAAAQGRARTTAGAQPHVPTQGARRPMRILRRALLDRR